MFLQLIQFLDKNVYLKPDRVVWQRNALRLHGEDNRMKTSHFVQSRDCNIFSCLQGRVWNQPVYSVQFQ